MEHPYFDAIKKSQKPGGSLLERYDAQSTQSNNKVNSLLKQTTSE